MTTGVSSTAVVSRLTARWSPGSESSTSSSHSSGVRCRPEPRGPVAGDVEHPCDVGDLGDDGDRHEEDHHRPDPLARGPAGRPAAAPPRSLVSRTQGCPVRRGAVQRRPSKRLLPTTCASACGVRGVGAHLAQVARDQAAGVLGHVGRAGHPHLHPAVRRAGPAAPTRRRTCWSGSPRSTPAPGRRGEHVGQRLAPDARRAGRAPGRLTPIDSRYGATLSPGRSAPYRAETTTSQRFARRRAAGSSEARSERVVQHPGVEVRGGDRGEEARRGVAGDLGGEVGADAQPDAARRGRR